MREYKHQHKWKSLKQAIAVGLSEARENGVKIPNRKNKKNLGKISN